MNRIKKGDRVVVIAGKDKGKQGDVVSIHGDRVVVANINMVKRHTKPTQKNPQGGIVEKEGTVAIANVLLWDEKLGRGTRTKAATDGGNKIRVGVKTGAKFLAAGM